MINDSKIFLGAALAFLALAIFFAAPALYSRLSVEVKAANLLQKHPHDAQKMKEAYLLLRQPQLFAGYERFDSKGVVVQNTLRYIDSKLFKGAEIAESDGQYIKLLLERRAAGSNLGLKTAVFFAIMAFLSFLARIREQKIAGGVGNKKKTGTRHADFRARKQKLL